MRWRRDVKGLAPTWRRVSQLPVDKRVHPEQKALCSHSHSGAPQLVTRHIQVKTQLEMLPRDWREARWFRESPLDLRVCHCPHLDFLCRVCHLSLLWRVCLPSLESAEGLAVAYHTCCKSRHVSGLATSLVAQ